MKISETLHCRPNSHSCTPSVKFNTITERQIMKAFLLSRLHILFCDLFYNKIQSEKTYFSMECYAVDSKIIQLLIQDIVDSGEYTLEGIAYCTRIPFDVIFDVACGNNTQLSMTLYIRVIHLYMQARPNIARLLFDKLNKINDNNQLVTLLF